MTVRHKVFVSYHHALDEAWRTRFETLFHSRGTVISRAVNLGDIEPGLKTETIRQRIRDEHLRDSSVTVVLIGARTWSRKHVDWEIGSSIRHTKYNPRSGLLGILLPSYPRSTPGTYSPYSIPPRLHDNIACGYARLIEWSDSAAVIASAIHHAFLDRTAKQPNNARLPFVHNRSGDRWQH